MEDQTQYKRRKNFENVQTFSKVNKVTTWLYAVILPALKIWSLSLIIEGHSVAYDWSTRQTAFDLVRICWGLVILFSILQLLFCFLPVRLTACLSTYRHEKAEFLGIITEIIYVIAIITHIHLVLKDDCFKASAEGDSAIMNEFAKKGQKFVLFPGVVLILQILFFVAKQNISEKNDTSKALKIRLAMDLLNAGLIPIIFCVAVWQFVLSSYGYCLLQILSRECQNVSFRIQVNSHIRFTMESTVAFPDPSIGIRTRTKLVNIHHILMLVKNSSSVDKTWCSEILEGMDSDTPKLIHCNYASYSVSSAAIDMHKTYLSTERGILLEWPCKETIQFRKLRDKVECLYRLNIQLNEKSKFIYNYDSVYKLPETSFGENNRNEWHKQSKYNGIYTIFDTDGDENGFHEFQNLFMNVDDHLVNHTLVKKHNNLLAQEPVILQIKCNSSCFCYECIAGDEHYLQQKHCAFICPNMSNYRGYTLKSFCNLNKPDACENKWVSVHDIAKMLRINYSDLVTVESSPLVTVFLTNQTFSAEYDPNIALPKPGNTA